jgi:putative transcriptional regulator
MRRTQKNRTGGGVSACRFQDTNPGSGFCCCTSKLAERVGVINYLGVKDDKEASNSLFFDFQMKAGQAARVTHVKVPPLVEVRNRIGLSQAQFARLLGVSVRTLQEREQGRRQPSGAAKTLLRVAERHPEVLRELAECA